MNIKYQLYAAIKRSIIGRYSVYLVNAISMMLLARLFSPETFGTTASITVFFVFFQMLSEAGLGPAIINTEKLPKVDRDGIFGLTVVVGLLIGGIFYSSAPFIAQFYRNPEVSEVIPYVAVSLVFYAASILPTAFLLRDQAFLSISILGMSSEAISTITTFVLCSTTDPLHALASKPLVSAATNFILAYYFSGDTQFGRPLFGTKFSAVKPLFTFSAYQLGFNVINYFTRNLDNIMVGRYLGSTSLGVYDKAYQIMRYPLMLLTFAMTPAIQPVIRRHSGDNKAIEEIHRDLTFKLSVAGAAIGLAVFLLSEQIVYILLGKSWDGVVPVIRILALAIPVQVVLSTSGSFFQALNRVDLLFRCGVFSSIITMAAIIWGVYQKDLVKLSWAITIAFHINFIQAYRTLYYHIFKKGMMKFLLGMSPAGVVTLSMTIAAFSS